MRPRYDSNIISLSEENDRLVLVILFSMFSSTSLHSIARLTSNEEGLREEYCVLVSKYDVNLYFLEAEEGCWLKVNRKLLSLVE